VGSTTGAAVVATVDAAADDVTGTMVAGFGSPPEESPPPHAATVRAGTATPRIRRVHIIGRTVPNRTLRREPLATHSHGRWSRTLRP
jgi:hypothetical protein